MLKHLAQNTPASTNYFFFLFFWFFWSLYLRLDSVFGLSQGPQVTGSYAAAVCCGDEEMEGSAEWSEIAHSSVAN